MQRILWTFIISIFVFLQFSLIYGENGWLEYRASNNEIAKLQSQNNVLKMRNLELREEVADLKSGLQEIENQARTQLGMVKKGEKFIWIPKQ